jgi:hypothetical protein
VAHSRSGKQRRLHITPALAPIQVNHNCFTDFYQNTAFSTQILLGNQR